MSEGPSTDPRRVVVFASGGGSNFQSLLDRFSDPAGSARIVGLIASRETAGAVDRAQRFGVPAAVTPVGSAEEEATFLLDALERWRGELIVLAGYLRLIPEEVVKAFLGRIINIHPALLPSFGGKGMYGSRVHEAVLSAGVRLSGATVHFVDEAYDRGPIIAQWPVPVRSDDVPQTLAARVLETEHALLPTVVEALATDRVSLDADGRVCWTEEWFEADRFQVGDSGCFGLVDKREQK